MGGGRHWVLAQCPRGGGAGLSDEARSLLEKAQRSICAAQDLLQGDNPDFASSRAYYAMFYVAEAFLGEEGLQFSKHGAVHAAFGETFAKSGRLDPKYHRWLLDAFDQRIVGDYGLEASLTADDAKTLISHAEQFLAEAWRQLAPGEVGGTEG